VAAHITPRTKAILAVDYAGHPCDYDALQALADRNAVSLVADACHALGGAYRGRAVGSLARLSTFSLHPVKPITAGEGGVVTTDDEALAARMRGFRNHGIATDFRQREAASSWRYEMEWLGNNYRLSDIQCALAKSQLRRLGEWTRRRQELARRYDAALSGIHGVRPLPVAADVSHGRHLYPVLLEAALADRRDAIFRSLRGDGIGVNVHYMPVHLHRFYRERYATRPGQCPAAEAAFERLLTLPLFARMQDDDVERVVASLARALAAA